MTAFNLMFAWLVAVIALLIVVAFIQLSWYGFVYLFNLIDRYIQR